MSKSKKATATVTPTTIAVAPAMGKVGKATAGGHVTAWRLQPAFAPTSTIKLVSTVNPWRANTPGHKFYVAVLAKNPATVQAALTLGATAGFNAAECQKHLRWLFTWGGAYLQVNGKLYSAPVATQAA